MDFFIFFEFFCIERKKLAKTELSTIVTEAIEDYKSAQDCYSSSKGRAMRSFMSLFI